jgi:plasmid stabilization system protein ParE
MIEIVWKRGAEEDVMSIYTDLEERREGAGDAFLWMLDSILQALRLHPQMAPVFEPPMRRLVAGNSGFGIFYTVEARGIIVHALIHLSRSPETIRAKIRRLLDLQ